MIEPGGIVAKCPDCLEWMTRCPTCDEIFCPRCGLTEIEIEKRIEKTIEESEF
jgi:exosome complex RNA-binding protein Csl4